MLNPSGLNFIPRGFAPWDEIVPWDLQFQCIPQNDRAIIYCTIAYCDIVLLYYCNLQYCTISLLPHCSTLLCFIALLHYTPLHHCNIVLLHTCFHYCITELCHFCVLSDHVDLITMSKIISRLLEKFQKSEYRSREADLTACIYKDFMIFLCFFCIPRTSTKELTNTGMFFSKVKLFVVISTTFEISRQIVDTTFLENGTF